MSINDSSAIILIIGAIAILAFVVHGLWFSGKSINRKLAKNSKEDQEIIKSKGVGKVRIVTSKSQDEEDIGQFETYGRSKDNEKHEKTVGQSAGFENKSVRKPLRVEQVYELNVAASQGAFFRGPDLIKLCREYGFMRNKGNLFCVYESPKLQDKVVFMICSLEKPYTFPADDMMQNYATRALALYMRLPEKGRAQAYFKAMRSAATLMARELGGGIYDNSYKLVTDDELNAIEDRLKSYDQG